MVNPPLCWEGLLWELPWPLVLELSWFFSSW